MRDFSVFALVCLSLASGCFGPKDDPTAPGKNYNPAAERDDFPAPSKFDVPRGSGGRSTDAAETRGSGAIFKDIKGLTPEKFQENYEKNLRGEDSDADTLQASDASKDDAAKPDDDPVTVPE